MRLILHESRIDEFEYEAGLNDHIEESQATERADAVGFVDD